MQTPNTAVVRCNSHRARRKLLAITHSEALYSFERDCTGGFFRIAYKNLKAALEITGVTRTKDGADLMKCWPNK